MQRLPKRLGFLLAALLFCGAAWSQDYPNKPIRMIVGFPPGGGADLIGRVVADQLGSKLGTRVIVENIPGAGTTIAVGVAAKAPSDGYTLLFATSSFTINPNLYKKVPYDAIKDFMPIARVGDSPFCIVVQASSPMSSITDLLASARSGKPLSYSSGGNGSTGHLAGELFKSMAKVDIQHIPHKGLAPALATLMGGQVDMTVSDLASSLGHVRAGRLKILGVTTSKRVPAQPNVATIAESGVPGYEVVLWNGLFAPAGTSTAIIDRIHGAVVSIFRTPDESLNSRFAALGVIHPVVTSSQEFGAFVRNDLAFWEKVVRQSGASVD